MKRQRDLRCKLPLNRRVYSASIPHKQRENTQGNPTRVPMPVFPKNCHRPKSAHIDKEIAPATCFRPFVDRTESILTRRFKPATQTAAFQPQPNFERQV